MNKTNINWCDVTWNPVTGCSKISSGCRFCYAETIANRFWGDRKFTDVQFHENRLFDKVLSSKISKRIFVNSMSDLFHEKITDEQIKKIMKVIYEHPQHTFLVLTKRVERINNFNAHYPPNLWLGFSASTQKDYNSSIDYLMQSEASIKWVSIEPQLESVNILQWGFIDWVVCGCESGNKRRPFDNKWALEIAEYSELGLPIWIKQIRDKNNNVVEDINLFPKELQIRELPK